MVWGRTIVILSGLFLLGASACGPEGQAAPDTDSEGETESEGASDSTGGSASATATATATMTAGSNSGSATTTASSATEDSSPPLDSSDDGPPATEETGECPYGTEGCLCDVGATCEEGLACNDEGICVAPPDCEPLDTDPHGDEASAYELEALGCGDAIDLGVVATLDAPETDWYTYMGGEAFMCPEQPAAVVAADVPADVCVFIECIEGDAVMVDCADGSSAADSPEGRPGCCGQDQAQIVDYDCMGQFAGLDVNVWISVGSEEEACADYALSYAM